MSRMSKEMFEKAMNVVVDYIPVLGTRQLIYDINFEDLKKWCGATNSDIKKVGTGGISLAEDVFSLPLLLGGPSGLSLYFLIKSVKKGVRYSTKLP